MAIALRTPASRRHELALMAATGAGIAAVGAIVARIGADAHWPIDHTVRNALRAKRHPKTRIALRVAGSAGTIGVYGPATLLTAFVISRRRQPEHALPIVATVAAAMLVSAVVKHIVKRPRPVGISGPVNDHPSFPSGHATRATAAACAIAYVLVRERMTSRALATSLAGAVAGAVGVSRAYADAHWTTDVIGGWALGAATAAAGALWYERVR